METRGAVEAHKANGRTGIDARRYRDVGGAKEIGMLVANAGGQLGPAPAVYKHSLGSSSGSGIGSDYVQMEDVRVPDTSSDVDAVEIAKVVGRLSVLSASAKEFTPFGGGNARLSGADEKNTGVGGGSNRHGGGEGEPLEEWVGPSSSDGVEGGLYAQVQLEADLLEIMAESFSEFSLECLQVALAKSDWDLDRASAGVLSTLEAYDAERPPTPKPCRHLLQGGKCLRSDCAFSHDFASTTCRYWLHGRCLLSSDCVFRHDLDVPLQGQESARVAYELEEHEGGSGSDQATEAPSVRGHGHDRSEDGMLDVFATEDFPLLAPKLRASSTSLGSSTGPKKEEAFEPGNRCRDVLLDAVRTKPASKKRNPGKRGPRGRKTRYAAVNIQALMRANPTSGNDGPTDSLNSYSSETASTVTAHEHTQDRPGRQCASGLTQDAAATTVTSRPTCGISFAEAVGSTRQGAVVAEALERRDGGDRGNDGTRMPVGSWVSTGTAVALQYEGARKEAVELARARNKLFTSATEAFRRGQGKTARDLARRGRELNEEMKEKHRQAASAIFASRNPGDQIFERRTIDLHALHVNEALEVLDRQLEALIERDVDSVRVLAGSGHHSKGPTSKARLFPAVEKFFQSRGLSYRLVADRGTSHVGVIQVNLTGHPDRTTWTQG